MTQLLPGQTLVYIHATSGRRWWPRIQTGANQQRYTDISMELIGCRQAGLEYILLRNEKSLLQVMVRKFASQGDFDVSPDLFPAVTQLQQNPITI
ncbi:hypothetical protein [Geobacter sp. OR-1]|uniref:hypothetical protein n=1 Tax=Geobacter sp. OR-1 TaxID=1266765 RepID=UPI00126A6687|nr:hypothetical protein [Geobacter sp. OR-1]